MSISYKKLWKLLIDKECTKKQLVEMTSLSTRTINKLNTAENVKVSTLAKICAVLECDFKDIMEFVDDGKELKEIEEEKQKKRATPTKNDR